MKKKNKNIIISFLMVAVGLFGYLIGDFKYSSKYNHCNDNLTLINEDLQALSQILKNSNNIKYEQVKSTLIKEQANNFNDDEKTIGFTLITVYFSNNGNLEIIEH